jgi:hypothetical protein
MISSAALVEKFQYALDNKWGYIWGTAGILWTKSKQKQKVDYMVSKYGTSWQKNSEAKDDNYYRAALIGDKWIDHYVADCSGLFRWAFEQYKLYIAHGSNTIWSSYCTSKGNLTSGKRSDGKSLRAGTAVFTDKNGNKSHIGLFIGGGKVIEASGTDAGVCVSNVSASKWKCWGELKNVSYESDTGFPEQTTWHPTVRRGSKGEDVKYVQKMLYKLGYNLGSYGIDGDYGRQTEAAVKEFQRDHGLNQDGIAGPMTIETLEKATAQIEGRPIDKSYTVCIHGLDKTQADALKNNYPGSIVTEE